MAQDPFRRAVSQLARLPGVGEKTATRFAYWILRQPPEVAATIAEAITTLRVNVRECGRCCDLTDGELCRRCADGPCGRPAARRRWRRFFLARCRC